MDRKAGESIQGVEEKVYIGTSVSCIRLCDRRSIVNRGRRWIIEASGISLKILEQNRKEL